MGRARRARIGAVGGIPLEEAPLWLVLVVASCVGVVLFLGGVGLLDAAGLWRGQWRATMAVTFTAAVALVVALSRLAPWSRERLAEDVDDRPRLVRLSSWLLGTAVSAFALDGVLALIWMDESPGPTGVACLSLLIAALRWILSLSERRSKRRRPRDA